MNVFDLDEALVRDYERFARSFTQIRAPDIRRQVEAIYASDRFWPEPLISINPLFERGASLDQLVDDGTIDAATARVFSVDGKPLTLYRHQSQAVAKALSGRSFVVTTGTGSGKSLCFFIPIVDAAIRARAEGEPRRPVAACPFQSPQSKRPTRPAGHPCEGTSKGQGYRNRNKIRTKSIKTTIGNNNLSVVDRVVARRLPLVSS